MQAVVEAVPALLRGARMTLVLTAGGLGLGLAIGLLMAAARLYGGPWAARSAIVYGRVLRSIPLIALLFMVYLTVIEFARMPPVLTAIVCIGLHSGAYQAEIFRGAIAAVPEGQVEAARSLGMTPLQALAYVVLPQALRHVPAAYSNEAAVVLKDTSFAYVIGVRELLRQADYGAARDHAYLTWYLAAGAVYFAITFSLNRGFDWLEGRMKIPGT